MIMDSFLCKFEDKKSGLRTNGTNGQANSLQTPGKIKSKKKMSIQNSSVSLESSGGGPSSSNDKKDQKGGEGGNAQNTIAQPQVSQA